MQHGLSLFFCFLYAASLQAQIPAGGTPLSNGDFMHNSRKPSADVAHSQIIEVEHALFSQALRVAVLQEQGTAWSVEVGNPTTLAVAQDDIALVHFWARGIESTDESGEAFVTLYAQKNSPDWDKSL